MINKVRLVWNSCSVFADFLFTNEGWTYLARKRRTDPIVSSYGILCSPAFDGTFSSAYELYADLSPKHESQPENMSQSKDESPKDDSLPGGGSPNTEDLQKTESSRKKEDKLQEKDRLSPKDSSAEGDTLKNEKGSGKRRTKLQETADKSSRMAQRFKETFSRSDVRVHFIGVWCVPTVMVVMGL